MKTGLKHKGLTPRTIKIHVDHVENLKQKCCGYGIDPFSNYAPRYLPTGEILETAIGFDMIRAQELNVPQYKVSPIKGQDLKTRQI